MKPHGRGTPVRFVNPDVFGEVLRTETNGDEFGYRVGFGGKKMVAEEDKDGALTGGQVEVWSDERFVSHNDLEVFLALGPGQQVSVSLSGTKDECLATIERLYSGNKAVGEALRYLVMAQAGEKLSLSGTIGTTVSLSGSSWNDTKVEEAK